MSTFITGATGYLGFNLAKKLADKGEQIHLLVRNPNALRELDLPNVRIFKGDLTDLGVLSDAMQGCNYVYHVAALARLWTADKNDFYRVNHEGTLNVLNTARRLNVRKFVLTSTGGVAGPSLNKPITEDTPRLSSFNNHYEISKYMAEEEVLKACREGFPGVIVRPTRVFGPGKKSASAAINRLVIGYMNRRIAMMPHKPDALGNYGYIDDIVDGHLMAMEHGKPGEIYFLGGENISYRRLFALMKKYTSTTGLVIRAPKGAIQFFSWAEYLMAKKFGREPSITPDFVLRLGIDAACDCSKAVAEIGYVITPFEYAFKTTIHSLQNQKLP